MDGVKYKNNSYLYHCDWGWSGTCNGYFAAGCFNTDKDGEYDSGVTIDDQGNYRWHFRLITYDVPTAANMSTISYPTEPVL